MAQPRLFARPVQPPSLIVRSALMILFAKPVFRVTFWLMALVSDVNTFLTTVQFALAPLSVRLVLLPTTLQRLIPASFAPMPIRFAFSVIIIKSVPFAYRATTPVW